MVELSRRGFLQLLGATVTLSAGGIALLEREPVRTYFLPPRGGWPGDNSWELELAQDELETIQAQLASYGVVGTELEINDTARILSITSVDQLHLDSLLQRHVRLTELAHGGRSVRD